MQRDVYKQKQKIKTLKIAPIQNDAIFGDNITIKFKLKVKRFFVNDKIKKIKNNKIKNAKKFKIKKRKSKK